MEEAKLGRIKKELDLDDVVGDEQEVFEVTTPVLPTLCSHTVSNVSPKVTGKIDKIIGNRQDAVSDDGTIIHELLKVNLLLPLSSGAS